MDNKIIAYTALGATGRIHFGTLREILIGSYNKFLFNIEPPFIIMLDDIDPVKPSSIKNFNLSVTPGTILSKVMLRSNCSLADFTERHLLRVLEQYNIKDFTTLRQSETLRKGHFDHIVKLLIDHKRDLRLLDPRTKSWWSPIINDIVIPQSQVLALRGNQVFFYHENKLHVREISGLYGKPLYKYSIVLTWIYYNVGYESFGKDTRYASDLAVKVMDLLGYTSPTRTSYEFLLNSNGKKISKSNKDTSKGEVQISGILRLFHPIVIKHVLLKDYSKCINLSLSTIFTHLNIILERLWLISTRNKPIPVLYKYLFEHKIPILRHNVTVYSFYKWCKIHVRSLWLQHTTPCSFLDNQHPFLVEQWNKLWLFIKDKYTYHRRVWLTPSLMDTIQLILRYFRCNDPFKDILTRVPKKALYILITGTSSNKPFSELVKDHIAVISLLLHIIDHKYFDIFVMRTPNQLIL